MINNYRDNYEGIFAKTPDAKKQITPKKKEEIPLEYQQIQEYLNAEGIDRPVMEVVREANSWFAKEVELLNEAQHSLEPVTLTHNGADIITLVSYESSNIKNNLGYLAASLSELV